MLQLTKRIILNLYQVRYFHFLITGGTGVAINLFTAWLWVNVFFTKENIDLELLNGSELKIKTTTIGIILGQTINLIYNFILYSIITFQTKHKHKRRFVVFALYSIFLSYLVVTPLILIFRDFLAITLTSFPLPLNKYLGGSEYLISSAVVIFFISIVNFFFFKKLLFKE